MAAVRASFFIFPIRTKGAAIAFVFLGRFAVHRNDGALVFRQEMAKAQNRMAPVLDVVACRHRDAAMSQGFARGKQSVAGMDLGAELFSQRMQRRLGNDAVVRSQASSARISFMQR